MKTLTRLTALFLSFVLLPVLAGAQAATTGVMTAANTNLTSGAPSTWSTGYLPASSSTSEVWTPLASGQTAIVVQVSLGPGQTAWAGTIAVRDTADSTLTTGGSQGVNVPNPASWSTVPANLYANEAGGYGIASGTVGNFTIPVHGSFADVTLTSFTSGAVKATIVPVGGVIVNQSLLSTIAREGLRVMVIGDSLAAQNAGDSINGGSASKATTMPQTGPNMFATGCVLSGAKFVRNAGVPGQTSVQILPRITTDLLPNSGGGQLQYLPRGNLAFELMGTNDYTIGGITNPLVSLQNIETAWRETIAAGIVPVACTLPPRSDVLATPTLLAFNRTLNNMIRVAAPHMGVGVCDINAQLDNGQGGYPGGAGGPDSADGVHPNPMTDGAVAAGTVAPLLSQIVNQSVHSSASASDGLIIAGESDPLQTAGVGLVTTITSGQPSDYTAYNSGGSITTANLYTVPSDGVYIQGNGVEGVANTANPTNTSDYYSFANITWNANSYVPTPGHKMFFSARLTTQNLAAGNTSVTVMVKTTQVFNGQTISTIVALPASVYPFDIPISQYPDGGKLYMEFVPPPYTTQIGLEVRLSATAANLPMSGGATIWMPTVGDIDANGFINNILTPGVIANQPGSILYVDQARGVDPSNSNYGPGQWGMRGDIAHPFATVMAATRASNPGDRIRVEKGYYSTDTIKSFAALRHYDIDPWAHMSDGSEVWITANYQTTAQQTANLLAFIDPSQPGFLWQNSGASTQTVKAGQLITVGTPQTLDGITVDPANNWTLGVNGGSSAMSSAAGPVTGTLVMQSTAAGTDLVKSITPPSNGHMTLIATMMSTNALASGNGQLVGLVNSTNAVLYFQWSTATHINCFGGLAFGGLGFNCTPTSWSVYSCSLGGANGLTAWLNGTSQGTSSQSAHASGAASSLNINGDPGVGQSGQSGNNFGPVELLSTDTEVGTFTGSPTWPLRVLWEDYDLIAAGAY